MTVLQLLRFGHVIWQDNIELGWTGHFTQSLRTTAQDINEVLPRVSEQHDPLSPGTIQGLNDGQVNKRPNKGDLPLTQHEVVCSLKHNLWKRGVRLAANPLTSSPPIK